MKHLILSLSLLMLPELASAQWHGSTAPDSLSYQGFVADSSGAGLNETANITFKLFKGATEIWSQTKTGVSVSDGVFNVILGGTGGASLDTVAFNTPIDLEVTYGSTVLSPRTPLTSAAYALGMRGMYSVWGDDGQNRAPNLIGGASNNFVAGGVVGATIGGGGGWRFSLNYPDSVLADWGTVGGGRRNTAAGELSTVGGGEQNRAAGSYATAAGGIENQAAADGSAVGGGRQNRVTQIYGTVGGGDGNDATGSYTVVGGGDGNTASGGIATVGGGAGNRALADWSTIGGGFNNQTSASRATVGGGGSNFASATHATIGGGFANRVGGRYATVAGGDNNHANAGFSFAAGQAARALHSGTFVWADSANFQSGIAFESTDVNQFLIRANGGVGIGTNAPDAQLDVAGDIRSSGTYSSTILSKNTNASGSPDGDGFRLRYDGDFFGTDTDALVIEKTDGNGNDPDGGIAFLNTGVDGNETVSLSIRGNGYVGIGTSSPARPLHIRHPQGVLRVDRDEANGGTTFMLHQYEETGGVETEWKTFTMGVDAAGLNNGKLEIRDLGSGASGGGNLRLEIANNGDVTIPGTLSKGGGSFKIDHPLDPANKYLYHSFVESPDMMNVYNGNIILDDNGEVTVELPDYFEALNRDFRYQLTAIGAPGPGLFIAEKVSGNQFSIAGGSAGMEVSWQVTGVRIDPYAEQNRIRVEVEKTDAEKGTYMHPAAYSGTN